MSSAEVIAALILKASRVRATEHIPQFGCDNFGSVLVYIDEKVYTLLLEERGTHPGDFRVEVLICEANRENHADCGEPEISGPFAVIQISRMFFLDKLGNLEDRISSMLVQGNENTMCLKIDFDAVGTFRVSIQII